LFLLSRIYSEELLFFHNEKMKYRINEKS